ncbi:MAG: chromosomal replication initiator DnaA [Sphingomonadaceae bacterium]|nr:chromosomal replication initiator DnaA [Sphingomonadaceae bacterium]
MSTPAGQIGLPLAWPEDDADSAFIVGESNRRAVRHLDHWALWPVAITLLTGPRKSGRSTLGRIFARKCGGTLIDDADLAEEEALFHAWNAAQAERRPLLMVADEPPPRWEMALPDLRSRMAATPKIVLGEPDDALIEALVERHYARRGLVFPANAMAWMLRRIERSHYAVHRALEAIDQAAFARGGGVTLALVRSALGDKSAGSLKAR